MWDAFKTLEYKNTSSLQKFLLIMIVIYEKKAASVYILALINIPSFFFNKTYKGVMYRGIILYVFMYIFVLCPVMSRTRFLFLWEV